jgi:hypothetical protein
VRAAPADFLSSGWQTSFSQPQPSGVIFITEKTGNRPFFSNFAYSNKTVVHGFIEF